MKEACPRWETRLTAWFDGELAPLDADEVRAHLLACPGCRAALARWRHLRGELGLLDAPAPDAACLERMAGRFAESLHGELDQFHRTLRWVNRAAALLLLAGAGLFAARHLLPARSARASEQRSIERELVELLRHERPAAAPVPAPQAAPAAAPGPKTFQGRTPGDEPSRPKDGPPR